MAFWGVVGFQGVRALERLGVCGRGGGGGGGGGRRG